MLLFSNLMTQVYFYQPRLRVNIHIVEDISTVKKFQGGIAAHGTCLVGKINACGHYELVAHSSAVTLI